MAKAVEVQEERALDGKLAEAFPDGVPQNIYKLIYGTDMLMNVDEAFNAMSNFLEQFKYEIKQVEIQLRPLYQHRNEADIAYEATLSLERGSARYSWNAAAMLMNQRAACDHVYSHLRLEIERYEARKVGLENQSYALGELMHLGATRGAGRVPDESIARALGVTLADIWGPWDDFRMITLAPQMKKEEEERQAAAEVKAAKNAEFKAAQERNEAERLAHEAKQRSLAENIYDVDLAEAVRHAIRHPDSQRTVAAYLVNGQMEFEVRAKHLIENEIYEFRKNGGDKSDKPWDILKYAALKRISGGGIL